jgi:hypothetical protein
VAVFIRQAVLTFLVSIVADLTATYALLKPLRRSPLPTTRTRA